MAGIAQPTVQFLLAPASSSGFPRTAMTAGQYESVCLCAAIAPPGFQDTYVNVHVYPDGAGAPAGLPFMIIYNEPVRFRQPGGNVVLLQNFIIPFAAQIVVENPAGNPSSIHFTLYNRWRFNA